MKNNRLIAVVATVAAVVCLVLLAQYFIPAKNNKSTAALASGLIEGTHYRTLGTPLSVPADGVSVTEFFWYGCPHCQAFEPVIKEWLDGAPDDVTLELVPVAWNDATRLHGAMYFVGKKAERPGQLHEALFDQIIDMRQERNLSRQVELVAGLFDEHGIGAEALKTQLNSPEVMAQVKQAEEEMRAAEVSSTPTLLVGGKYVLLNNEAVADKGMFEVVNALVEMSRQ